MTEKEREKIAIYRPVPGAVDAQLMLETALTCRDLLRAMERGEFEVLGPDGERAAIAAAGREKYHRIFSGARVLRFMVETMTGEKYSEDYEWAEEVYR